MSTPDLPYGVLHVVTISCHMEYSIWSFFGAIWSALGFTTEVKFYCHMEYSTWLFYDAIWIVFHRYQVSVSVSVSYRYRYQVSVSVSV